MRPRSDRAAYLRTSVMRPPRWRSEGGCPTVRCSTVSSRARSRGLLADARRLRVATLHSMARSQARSRTQLQSGLADADRLAGVDQQRSLHPLLIEVGAVGRPEVLHVPLSTAVGQTGVTGA